MKLLDGKVLLITGGASGIGLATARLAAAEGARVAICDVDHPAGERAAAAVGGDSHFFPMDVTDDAAVNAAIDACARELGRLDHAFNNAGISGAASASPTGKAGDIDDGAWNRVLDVNLTGTWRCMRAELRHMVAQRKGAIVNNASIAGLVGLKGHAAYAATKHGVVGLTRSAAADYASSGIRINAICPGFVATPLTSSALEQAGDRALQGVPLRRLGTPEEIAEAVVWLLSDRAGFVTGIALAADGGYTAL